MSPLTANERLIWAAAYAAAWARGPTPRMNVSDCIESAWSTVVEARGAAKRVRAIWGEDDEVYQALKQMIQPE